MLRGRCRDCRRPIVWRTGKGWQHNAQRVEHEAVPLNLSDAHLLFNPTVTLREAETTPRPPDDPPF